MARRRTQQPVARKIPFPRSRARCFLRALEREPRAGRIRGGRGRARAKRKPRARTAAHLPAAPVTLPGSSSSPPVVLVPAWKHPSRRRRPPAGAPLPRRRPPAGAPLPRRLLAPAVLLPSPDDFFISSTPPLAAAPGGKVNPLPCFCMWMDFD